MHSIDCKKTRTISYILRHIHRGLGMQYQCSISIYLHLYLKFLIMTKHKIYVY